MFLLADCDQATAKELMEKLLNRLKQFKPCGIEVTVSIGIATTDDDKQHTLNSLFDLADSAMYQAKMAGRNCIEVYGENEIESGSDLS